MSPSKRKSTPSADSPTSKRQRLDSPSSLSHSHSHLEDNDDDVNTLSSLSNPSSPENALASHAAVGSSLVNEVLPGVGSKGLGGASTEGEGDEDEDNEEEEDDSDEEPLADQNHPVLSAKSVPPKQPRPSDLSNHSSLSNKENVSRPIVGGKGKKGEEALEHAVAAREEVERRRNALGSVAGKGAKAKATGTGPTTGEEEVKVKEEEGEEEVEVLNGEDAEEATIPVKRERPAISEERQNIIQFRVVTNDGTPQSMIILSGLKNIFQKQLPKMPREYIARLVFDRNHYSMAIVKRGLEVVGGITYRPFEARKFAEIVFCAITGTEQVKGYGSHLMNHLKDYVKQSTACMHFLTYADNYAIGYFKKQGFTKEVGLDRSVWAAYIKDYEGGTIMHCSMLPKVKYLDVRAMLAAQKEVILSKIRLLSRSHIIHPGLDFLRLRGEKESVDPADVPGLKESGWTPEMDELTRRPKRGPKFAIMQRLLTNLTDHPSAWAFANPVNAAEVTDYYDVIKEPMDLATMDRKLESNAYTTIPEFLADAKKIFVNCRAYNDNGSNYVKNANKLEAYLEEQVKIYSSDH